MEVGAGVSSGGVEGRGGIRSKCAGGVPPRDHQAIALSLVSWSAASAGRPVNIKSYHHLVRPIRPQEAQSTLRRIKAPLVNFSICASRSYPMDTHRHAKVYTVAATPKDETQKTNCQRGQKLVRPEDEDELAPRPRS